MYLNIDVEKFVLLMDVGMYLGKVKEEWLEKYDIFNCDVVIVVIYDIVLVVVGILVEGENWVFLSSGIWLLIGMELSVLINNEVVFKENYMNEWGVYGIYCFLKNIMGFWIV